MTKYFIETWDGNLEEFTPQKGVPRGPYTKWGLRKAIRKLRKLGYSADYSRGVGDPSVSIYSDDAMESYRAEMEHFISVCQPRSFPGACQEPCGGSS